MFPEFGCSRSETHPFLCWAVLKCGPFPFHGKLNLIGAEEKLVNYYGGKQLAESFRTVRKNTVAIAEDIPEDKYDFRPMPETRSVGELWRTSR